MVACGITGDMRFEVRQILCILSFYQTFIPTILKLGFWVLGRAIVTLHSLYDYIVETDFAYRTLVFFSERMDAQHDVAVTVVEQQLSSSRLL
jgi:hypothetical protein